MIKKDLVRSFTLMHLLGWIFCLTVDIKVQPEFIEMGDELSVSCSVVDDPLDKSFKTFLKCPFYGKEDICIMNCDSTDICSSISCNRKKVANQSFQCDLNESPTRLTYTYRFNSITDSIIRNRKQIPFSCSFKGEEAKGFANIITYDQEQKPIPPIEAITSTTRSPMNINSNRNRINNAVESDNILPVRYLILIVILSGLLISFLINVWCCVQWCMRNSKIRTKKRKMKCRQMAQTYDTHEENNEINSQYYTHDYIKRAQSHPTLMNTDRNIPKVYIPPNLHQLNADLINNRQKFRNSVHNSTVLDEEDMNNGSNRSLLNSLYGQMVIAPIQYLDPSVIPCLSLPQNYSQQMQINSDHERSHHDVHIVPNQDIPGRHDTSLFHSLPKKPE